MAKQKALAFALSYVATVCDQLNTACTVAAIVSAEKDSIAGGLRDAIFALRDAAPDTGAYLTACEFAHGNGRPHMAKDHVPGAIRTWLTDNKGPADTVKVYLSKVRTVALHLADPAHNAKRCDPNGKPLSLDALYKVAHVAKNASVKTADKAPADAPEPAEPAAPETLSQMVARFGIVAVMRECAAILRTAKKTKTEAIALEAIAAKI